MAFSSVLVISKPRFVDDMPNARLVWVEECGHVPHLEKPDETASAILQFAKNGNPPPVSRLCDRFSTCTLNVGSLRPLSWRRDLK